MFASHFQQTTNITNSFTKRDQLLLKVGIHHIKLQENFSSSFLFQEASISNSLQTV